MGQFHDVSYEGALSIEECDRIAINEAGVISANFGYGYACPKGGKINAEYDSVVVNKQGMGNHGCIILRGLNPRSRALIREGKVLTLTRREVPWIVARVAPSCQYGMEIPVCMLAADLLDVVRHIGPFHGDSHRSFERWAGSWTGNIDMSFPRKFAAAHIAETAVFRSGHGRKK